MIAQFIAATGVLAAGVLGAGYAVFKWDAVRYRRRRQTTAAAAPAASLHVNHAYLLDCAERFASDHPGCRVLDYGCGAGETVRAGRARGLAVYGTDLYTDAASPYREEAARLGLLGDAIREIRDGRIDFPDASFDFAISNQVFEHVEDLQSSLAELARVLRPGARAICLFPSREVVREGHIGIPLAHRFPKGSTVARAWVTACRSAGLGYVKDPSVSNAAWASDALGWVDGNTYYRSVPELRAAFEKHFMVAFREEDNLRFRLERQRRNALARVVSRKPAALLARGLFRRSAGLVLVATRR